MTGLTDSDRADFRVMKVSILHAIQVLYVVKPGLVFYVWTNHI